MTRKKPCTETVAPPEVLPANAGSAPDKTEAPDLRVALREDGERRGKACLEAIRAALAEHRCTIVAWPIIEEDGRLGARYALRPDP